MLEDPNDKRHGTHNGYANYGCRCDKCKARESEYRRAWHASRRSSNIKK